MRLAALAVLALGFLVSRAEAAETRSFAEIAAKARGQTVYWNAWAGDPQTNAFIASVGDEVRTRYGVTVNHVKLKDTAEAVTRVVAEKAAGRAQGGACASDAFYPFPDGVEAAAAAGVAVVVQPGGSVGDEKVIAAADELGLAMVFTGERHFLH